MDKKLILICLSTGILTTLITGGLARQGILLYFLTGTLLIPPVLFSFVLTTYYKTISRKHYVIFTCLCSIIYVFSAVMTFNLDSFANGLAFIFFSTLTLPLITLIFNSIIKKLTNLKKSVTIAIIGGFASGFIIFCLTHLFKTRFISMNQDINSSFIQLLIYPMWQTAFGMTVK